MTACRKTNQGIGMKGTQRIPKSLLPLIESSGGQILPKWKFVWYSIAIIEMPLLGFILGKYSLLPYLRESVEAIPVLVCLIFVLRLPARPRMDIPRWLRVLFLLAPFPMFFINVVDFPLTALQQGAVSPLIFVDAIAIGVSEEVTFRFSLHRLWAQKSVAYYIVFSSLIFGLMHISAGIGAVLIAGIIGASFALARVAGMPIWVLIIAHGLATIRAVP
jgi:membrane protease YdiL (CAAX protease family)